MLESRPQSLSRTSRVRSAHISANPISLQKSHARPRRTDTLLELDLLAATRSSSFIILSSSFLRSMPIYQSAQGGVCSLKFFVTF